MENKIKGGDLVTIHHSKDPMFPTMMQGVVEGVIGEEVEKINIAFNIDMPIPMENGMVRGLKTVKMYNVRREKLKLRKDDPTKKLLFIDEQNTIKSRRHLFLEVNYYNLSV